MDFFRQAYSRLSSYNYTHLLVLGLVIKAIVSDVSIATFLLTIPVLAFESYKMYLKSKVVSPIELDAEVRKELDNIKSKLNAQTLEKGLKAPVSRYF